ncbi:MAG: LysR substrate-binding domain-containing protein [Pseudomonadota bacterium]
MEFSQLRTIINVAELGSLSKAADRLHIAQPALSRQVRMLEEELGVRLFERHGRGMVISEAGQDVLRHAYRILAEMQEIRAIQSDDQASLKGNVSLGMPPTVSDILAEPVVSAFRARHPEATIRIVSAYSSYILDWLHKGEIDVAILFESTSARSLRSEPLLEEQLFLIGPQGALGDEAVEFDTLSAKTLLLPSMGHSLRSLLEVCAKGHGFALNVSVETDSYSTLKNLVKAGHGNTILPLAPIHEEVSSGQLSCAPLIKPVPKRRLMISFPSDRPPTRLARFAYEVLQRSTYDLVQTGVWPGEIVR